MAGTLSVVLSVIDVQPNSLAISFQVAEFSLCFTIVSCLLQTPTRLILMVVDIRLFATFCCRAASQDNFFSLVLFLCTLYLVFLSPLSLARLITPYPFLVVQIVCLLLDYYLSTISPLVRNFNLQLVTLLECINKTVLLLFIAQRD